MISERPLNNEYVIIIIIIVKNLDVIQVLSYNNDNIKTTSGKKKYIFETLHLVTKLLNHSIGS